jgi:hypothetical protein
LRRYVGVGHGVPLARLLLRVWAGPAYRHDFTQAAHRRRFVEPERTADGVTSGSWIMCDGWRRRETIVTNQGCVGVAADPEEGLDADGFITTGVHIANVRAPYDAVLSDVRNTIGTVLGSKLHGLYLYGSVATGQAMPPTADLDLSAIVTSSGVIEDCRYLGEELSARHRLTVRDVGISTGLLEDVLARNDAGRAERCFLKHYCVSVAGVDLRPQLLKCRPDRALAREFIGELEPRLKGFAERLDAAVTPADVEAVAVLVGRRLLMAAAVLYSIPNHTWTTARTAGARMIAQHHPAYARYAARALAWVSPTTHEDPRHVTPTREDVEVVLHEVGVLIMRDVRQHLAPRT